MRNFLVRVPINWQSQTFRQIRRSMRLTFILLSACFLHVSASGYSQKVSIDQDNVSLGQLLRLINSQTGLSYSINSQILEKAKPVSLHVKDADINYVLDLSLKNQALAYTIKDNVIVIKEQALVQGEPERKAISIKGRIVNEKGEPVSATITVKRTNNATATDLNGIFFLNNVDEDAILVITGISIIGYEIKVKGKVDLGTISVRNKVIEGEVVEVANTGFQKVKPNETTGSLVVIDNKTLNEQAGTNILQRLNGVTSSLIFNINKGPSTIGVPSKTNISIRGFSSINGPLDPLIVVDNFIYDGDINNINPNDVENITILKDGAATSIYGAQGGNGVIVITMKRSKFNQKLKIDMNSNVTIIQKPDPYSLPGMSSGDYIDIEQYLFNNYYPTFTDAIFSYPSVALTPAVKIFLDRQNGLISAEDSVREIDALKSIDGRDQFNKYFNRNSITQQYSLSIKGGGNNIAWLISGGYNRMLLENGQHNDQLNLRFNNSYKPAKNLTVNVSSYYTNTKLYGNEKPSYNSFEIMGRKVPYLQFGDGNGNPLPIPRNFNDSYLDTLGSGKLLSWKYYPTDDYKHTSRISRLNDLTANIGINYQFLKNFEIDFSWQYQKQRVSSESIADEESYEARAIVNKFSQLVRDADGNVVNVNHNVMPEGAIFRSSNSGEHSQNLRAQLNYTKISSVHSITTFVGIQKMETVNDRATSSTIYGYQADPLNYGIVDYVNLYPDIFDGYQSIPGAPTVGPKISRRFLSVYANGAYSYKQRYTLSLSARRDGSNIFGASTNDKWKPLWSAGLGWDISAENFYKMHDLFPILQFKTSLGYSGNVDLSRTPYPIALYSPSDPNTGLPFAQIVSLNNPSLRWEQSKQINFEMNFSTKKGVISGSIAYYLKKGTDLYGIALSDYTAGGTQTVIKNIANLKGKGMDIQIISKNIDKTFKWTTRLLLNYNTNKVTKYFGPDAQNSTSLFTSSNIVPVVGKPLYGVVAYKWGGLNNQGDPQGFLNGELSTDYYSIITEAGEKGEGSNFKYIGQSTPPVWGSVSNEFFFKGFSLLANITYKLGYYFNKPTFDNNALFQSGIGNIDFEKRWKEEGDELHTNVPALVSSDYPQFEYRNTFYLGSEVNVLKAANVRLQYINLAYTIENKSKKHSFNQLRFYFNASNLGILWRANKEKLDPDYPGIFGLSKSYTVGVNLNF